MLKFLYLFYFCPVFICISFRLDFVVLLELNSSTETLNRYPENYLKRVIYDSLVHNDLFLNYF